MDGLITTGTDNTFSYHFGILCFFPVQPLPKTVRILLAKGEASADSSSVASAGLTSAGSGVVLKIQLSANQSKRGSEIVCTVSHTSDLSRKELIRKADMSSVCCRGQAARRRSSLHPSPCACTHVHSLATAHLVQELVHISQRGLSQVFLPLDSYWLLSSECLINVSPGTCVFLFPSHLPVYGLPSWGFSCHAGRWALQP